MGRLTTLQGGKFSSTRPRNSGAHGTSVARKVGTLSQPHSTTNATAFTYQRHGESASPQLYSFPHNGAMSAMSSADAATGAARLLSDTLANPAPAAPFTRFGAQTMNAIRQLADNFSATGAPTPTTTPSTRHTRETIQLRNLYSNKNTKHL